MGSKRLRALRALPPARLRVTIPESMGCARKSPPRIHADDEQGVRRRMVERNEDPHFEDGHRVSGGMKDRTNTIAGWVLFAGICALGFSVVTGEYFHSERPEKMGYTVEGVEADDSGGGEVAEKPAAFYLSTADAQK